MEFEDFGQAVQDDEALHGFVSDVAQDVPVESERFGVDPAVLAAATPLVTVVIYHTFKNLADWNRGNFETNIVRERAAIIEKLTKSGIPFKQASDTVQALQDQVQKGRLTDGVWEKLQSLFGKGTPPTE
jgi:hypothetical protein